jgi:regulatory protein SWI6
MEVQGVACMRRRSDGWLNATQILKVAGVDKGKRTKVLEKEILVGEHEKVQGGYGKYQGTWISYKRGREFCRQYGVEEMLRPLLDYDVSADGSGGQGQDTPTKEQAMAANRKRFYNHLDSGPSRGPSTNGTFFSNISPSTSVALAAMNKAARLNSPVPRSGNIQRQPARHHSQHEIFPGGSQQSMAPQNSFDTESRFDSGYGTQPNSSHEPPRKRKRLNSNEGMGPPSLPQDNSMRSATPTEPSESFLFENTLSQEFANAGSDTALPPLPPPNTDEQTEKLNLILDLFAESSRTDYSTHPAILQLSGEDFNMPLDHSSNSALHWAATLAKVSLLKLLLWKGANIWRGNAAGQSPLISAVIVNNCWEHSCFPELLELLSPLIEVRDIQGRTVLHHIAVSSGIKGRAPSSKYYLEALLEFLVRVGTQPGSSNNASATSTAAAVASLASQQTGGDDLSQESNDVPSKGAVSLVRFLSHIVNAKDKAGNTALNLVARIGNRSIIQQLLEIHADPGLANNKGVSAKDFGVGTDSGEGLLVNGFASQQSTQQAPASQPEPEVEAPASSSQTEDLSQEVISCMYPWTMSSHERITDLSLALTSMLTQNLTSHKDLLRQRTEQIDRLNEQIRDFSALQKAELERFQEMQARIKSRGEKQAKLANLRRILQEKRAGLSPSAHAESQSGTTELGAADSALVPEDLAAVLPNIPASDAEITPEQRSLFTSALPVPSELRTRLHAYSTNNQQLRDHANELRGRSNELEDLYRRVVSLCTGVDEDKVEEALPNLLAAIESESTAGVEGEGDVVRVRDFLRRVDGGQAIGVGIES